MLVENPELYASAKGGNLSKFPCTCNNIIRPT